MSNLPLGFVNISGGSSSSGSSGAGTSSTFLAGNMPIAPLLLSSTTTSTNYIPLSAYSNASNFTAGANQIALVPIIIPTTITANLALGVTSTGSSNARVVIYNAHPITRLPHTLYFASESFSLAIPGGNGRHFVRSTSSTTIVPGAYWAGAHTSDNAATLYAASISLPSSFYGLDAECLLGIISSGCRSVKTGVIYADGAPSVLGDSVQSYGYNCPVVFAKFISSP